MEIEAIIQLTLGRIEMYWWMMWVAKVVMIERWKLLGEDCMWEAGAGYMDEWSDTGVGRQDGWEQVLVSSVVDVSVTFLERMFLQ